MSARLKRQTYCACIKQATTTSAMGKLMLAFCEELERAVAGVAIVGAVEVECTFVVEEKPGSLILVVYEVKHNKRTGKHVRNVTVSVSDGKPSEREGGDGGNGSDGSDGDDGSEEPWGTGERAEDAVVDLLANFEEVDLPFEEYDCVRVAIKGTKDADACAVRAALGSIGQGDSIV